MPESMPAIRLRAYGGPESLSYENVAVPEPAPGEVRVRLEAAGVNFIDVYHRTGFYPRSALPAGLGKEAAGVVSAIGPGVEQVSVGDRVGFCDADAAYAGEALIRAERAIPLPPAVSARDAAAVLLKGLTAHYLTRTIRPLEPGDTVLIHAVAGGVGLLATQMAKRAGARVIGTCSTQQKAERARQAGADEVILYRDQDFVAEALRLTAGRGVDLAIDGVGRATFPGSVEATRVRGHVILFGQASGAPEPIDPRRVLGSRTLTTASLFDYAREREELLARAGDVLGWLATGELDVHVDAELPLRRAAEAHRRLEGRRTTGKLLLIPERT